MALVGPAPQPSNPMQSQRDPDTGPVASFPRRMTNGRRDVPAKRPRVRASQPSTQTNASSKSGKAERGSLPKRFDVISNAKHMPAARRALGTVVYAGEPPGYLKCTICNAAVMKEAHVLKGACMHTFCRECLLNEVRTTRACPKCKATSNVQGGPVESLVLRNTDMCALAESQLVHCPCGVTQSKGKWFANPNGCSAVFPMKELHSHAAQCAHIPVQCGFRMGAGCQWRGKGHELAAHEANCVFMQLKPLLVGLQEKVLTLQQSQLALQNEVTTLKAQQRKTNTELAAMQAVRQGRDGQSTDSNAGTPPSSPPPLSEGSHPQCGFCSSNVLV